MTPPDIERAARALMASDGDDPDRATAISDRPIGWMLVTEGAIAVLEALAEPSDAAVAAAKAEIARHFSPAIDSYAPYAKVMIDIAARAALRAARLAEMGREE